MIRDKHSLVVERERIDAWYYREAESLRERREELLRVLYSDLVYLGEGDIVSEEERLMPKIGWLFLIFGGRYASR